MKSVTQVINNIREKKIYCDEDEKTLYFNVAKLNAYPITSKRTYLLHASRGDERTVEFSIYCRNKETNEISWLTEFDKNNLLTVYDEMHDKRDVNYGHVNISLV